MKKVILLITICQLAIAAMAQDAGLPPRPYTATEMKRWSQVCDWLGNALPKTYGDFKVMKPNCSSFDWAEVRNGKPLTVITKKNEPIGNNPYHNLSFLMDEDTADAREKAIQAELLNAVKPDGSFDAKALNMVSVKTEKFNQSHNPEITVQTNVKIDIAKQYEKSTRPIKLDIGANGFAYLYIFPEGKEAKEEGSTIGTDGLAFYKDKALIILSAKAPKVVTQPSCNCTWREDKIYPQDGASEVSTAPIKNIVVQVYGYESDVRALVRLIDWKSLQALLGK